MEKHRVKGAKFDAFVKSSEFSLALSPVLRIRHRSLHLECAIAAIDCEFERSVGCDPFHLCSLQTFSAYYANFDDFYQHSWISPEKASADLSAALAPYLDLVRRYPSTRSAMSRELRNDTFAGLPLKYFAPTPKTKAFLDWLGASGTLPPPH